MKWDDVYKILFDSEAMSFGTILKSCRKELKWSQRELARHADIRHGNIGMLERDKTSCGYTQAQKLANAFGLTGDDRHAFIILAIGRSAQCLPLMVAIAAALHEGEED